MSVSGFGVGKHRDDEHKIWDSHAVSSNLELELRHVLPYSRIPKRLFAAPFGFVFFRCGLKH